MIVIEHNAKTNIMKSHEGDAIKRRECITFTVIPETDEEKDGFLSCLADRGWIKDNRPKAEPEPAAVPDPEKVYCLNHCYIAGGDERRFTVLADDSVLGEKISCGDKHDPACPQCHPAPKPLAVGDRFRVSDVLASADLRKSLSRCKLFIWEELYKAYWLPTPSTDPQGCYTKDKREAFQYEINEFHWNDLRSELFIEIASLPEPKGDMLKNMADIDRNLRTARKKLDECKKAADPDPQDFRERYRARHHYRKDSTHSIFQVDDPSFSHLEDYPVNPNYAPHYARNCPECHRIARTRRVRDQQYVKHAARARARRKQTASARKSEP